MALPNAPPDSPTSCFGNDSGFFDTAISTRPHSSIISSHAKSADPFTMASSPDSTKLSGEENYEEKVRLEMERDYFIPGEITLARSNEESCFLTSTMWGTIKQRPWLPLKSIKSLPSSDETRRKIQLIYPLLEEIIKQYWSSDQVDITEYDMRIISGLDWYTKRDEEIAWLVLAGNEHPLLKQIARDIGKLLKELGFTDMECVILKDTFHLQASPTFRHFAPGQSLPTDLALPMKRSILERMRHFYLVCGSAIGLTPRDWEGTSGFYLTNGKDIVCVSCSHVLCLRGDDEHEESYKRGPGSRKVDVQMPAALTYSEIREANLSTEESLDKLIARRSKAEDSEEMRASIEMLRQQSNVAKYLRRQILPLYASPRDRRVGFTLWTSRTVESKSEDFAIDVGLLQLDLDSGKIPQNKIPLVGIQDEAEFKASMQLGNRATYPWLDSADPDWITLRPSRYVPRRSFESPPTTHLNGDGEPQLAVMMTGRTSGTKVGTLDAETCRRKTELYARENGEVVFVKHYTITGLKDKKNIGGEAFTQKGDSGALCVCPDEHGNPAMLGLVIGGSGQTNRTDKTYIYPMFHFFEVTLPELIKRGILPEGPKKWSMDLETLGV